MPPRSLQRMTYFPCIGSMRVAVAGDDVVGEPLGVRSAHADLALDGDVPQRDVLRQRLVLGRGATVFGPHVAARMVDAVVGRRAPAARFVGQVPVRRFPDAGGDEQFHGRPAALAKVDRHDAVRLIDGMWLMRHGYSGFSGAAVAAPSPRSAASGGVTRMSAADRGAQGCDGVVPSLCNVGGVIPFSRPDATPRSWPDALPHSRPWWQTAGPSTRHLPSPRSNPPGGRRGNAATRRAICRRPLSAASRHRASGPGNRRPPPPPPPGRPSPASG